MRVALLNDSFPPVIDGVANVTLNYARLLAAGGDDVCVATPAVPGAQDDYPFLVLRYPSLGVTQGMGYRAGVPFSPKLLRELEEFRPDILHTHCPVMSAVLARLVRPRVQAPVIFTYHTKFDIDIQKAIHGRLLQEASLRTLVDNISAADEVWVVSRGAGENLRSLGYTGPYTVMENGVDFTRGAPAAADVAAARARYGIPDGLPVFLYVGRMMWYKGLETSLSALAAAAEKGLDFRFVLVGDGVDRAAVEARAAELGLQPRCVFTGAVHDREALRALFGCADLFLFPSTFDTNGLVVREAAACGCPSLLVRGSCAAEGVADGETGFLFDGSVEEMAACILRLAADRPCTRRVGAAAAQRLYLSWQGAVARARDRYAQVLDAWRDGSLQPKADEGLLAETGLLLAGLGRAGEKIEDSLEQAQEKWTDGREQLQQKWTGTREKIEENLAQAEEKWSDARQKLEDDLEQAGQKLTGARQKALEDWQRSLQDLRRLWEQRMDGEG